MRDPVRIAITGAAGNIGYALAFRIAAGDLLGPDQPVVLQLIEIPPAMKALAGGYSARAAAALEVCGHDPLRAARMVAGNARRPAIPGFGRLTESLVRATWFSRQRSGIDGEIQRATNSLVLERLMLLSINEEADEQVRAIAFDRINQLDNWLSEQLAVVTTRRWRSHYSLSRHRIKRLREDPASLDTLVPVTPPPGSPIGVFSPIN